jgi:hypothetical protein
MCRHLRVQEELHGDLVCVGRACVAAAAGLGRAALAQPPQAALRLVQRRQHLRRLACKAPAHLRDHALQQRRTAKSGFIIIHHHSLPPASPPPGPQSAHSPPQPRPAAAARPAKTGFIISHLSCIINHRFPIIQQFVRKRISLRPPSHPSKHPQEGRLAMHLKSLAETSMLL